MVSPGLNTVPSGTVRSDKKDKRLRQLAGCVGMIGVGVGVILGMGDGATVGGRYTPCFAPGKSLFLERITQPLTSIVSSRKNIGRKVNLFFILKNYRLFIIING
jgi:hypothetical protein